MATGDSLTSSTSVEATGLEPLASARAVYSGKVFPNLQISTFRNIDRLFPSRVVKRGSETREIPVSEDIVTDIQFRSGDEEYDLFDYMSQNRVAALLILKNDKIRLERHEFDLDAGSRWMSMSIAKSISSTLVGIAIADGIISSIDDQLTTYLPELVGSGYDGVSVRHLLQMTSGVQWDETPTDPQSDRGRMLELQIQQRPGEIMRYMASLPRIAEPGTVWNYSTGETHVVGALLRAATGVPVANYLSDKLWSRLGMESDATWWLESPDGLEVAGSGFSATLRDYGRFGQFIMNDGVFDGERILPAGWVREAGSPREIGDELVEYGYMWWPVRSPDGQWDHAFKAAGLFGQYVYINPNEQVVVVVWSARSKPLGAEVITDTDFFNAVVEQVG